MTGSRTGMTKHQKNFMAVFFDENNITEVHHGDCIGADAEFHQMAIERNILTVIHPPDNSRNRAFCLGDKILGQLPYLVRNKAIVLATDLLVALPSTSTETVRSGTWSTVRYARNHKKPVHIILPK